MDPLGIDSSLLVPCYFSDTEVHNQLHRTDEAGTKKEAGCPTH
jgi:hypothetical protein